MIIWVMSHILTYMDCILLMKQYILYFWTSKNMDIDICNVSGIQTEPITCNIQGNLTHMEWKMIM